MTDTDVKSSCGEKIRRTHSWGEGEEGIIRRNEQINVTNFGDAVLSKQKFSDLNPQLHSIAMFEKCIYCKKVLKEWIRPAACHSNRQRIEKW